MYFSKINSSLNLLLFSLTLLLLSTSDIGTKGSSKVNIGDQLETAPVAEAHQCMYGSCLKSVAKVTDEDPSTTEGPLNINSGS